DGLSFHVKRGDGRRETKEGRREMGDGKRLTWETRRARRMTAKIFLRALRVLRVSVFRFRSFARWSRAKRTRLRYCLSLSLSAAGALSLPCEKIASPCGLTNFRVMRSDSPIARYFSRSLSPRASDGGRVHTPFSWSWVYFGFALISLSAASVKPASGASLTT